MSNEDLKSQEIRRLTTPLTIRNNKVYDDKGKLLKCVETVSDVRFIIEPDNSLLTDNEILQYAPESKSAAKIRLKRGKGDYADVLLIYESVPWAVTFYYVVILSLSVLVGFYGDLFIKVILLILFIFPLLILYHIFNLNRYIGKSGSTQNKSSGNTSSKTSNINEDPDLGNINMGKSDVEDGPLNSLQSFRKEAYNLKVLFDVKENSVKDLIEKKFDPPQITYDKFITLVDNSHFVFYKQYDAIIDITQFASEDNEDVRKELNLKLQNMKDIINYIEELTNELVLNINDDNSNEEVKELLEEMENLVDSVKEYE
ncbi:hypothetical protein [uncultured Methanobrevibacter sp.]|uniref:hypothetical protein n=1 Tax=uncultured Methanobrevibacter sp. TaxID=253161 RepID=UPI0025FF5B6A|nr:hypothetical protein [uncultured Methanobrevibacter sp.]